MAEEVAMAPAYDDLHIFADSHDLVWETENENDQAEDDLMDNQLAMLQKPLCKKQPSAAAGVLTALGAPPKPMESEA